ncbi:MaoC/PaaZ C-terminal domain-containing protein [Quadrisphaera sp. DSM 44207]|uniref:MaoC/PaaZ C-terminal domain-containing protein n=1 Tax=Quadrisphaera sp. DSM 44207 TaxID=1881057 RepID=UPI000886888B|nr:MaoC/PaaZ C-terminal domain-containing protein [Quadrisphaera sp. DSM 44207]SDQ14922.1 Acyl dehydratase [Quadrisphaera sp. DSM 44207]
MSAASPVPEDRPRLADLAVGQQVGTLSIALVRADLVRYAGASGDLNPIHWDERTAAAAGLPDVIAHGMLTMAGAVRLVVDWCGDPAAVLDYGVRFTGLVPVPAEGAAVVDVTGTVAALDPEAGTARIDLAARCGGSAVLGRARAVVRLP